MGRCGVAVNAAPNFATDPLLRRRASGRRNRGARNLGGAQQMRARSFAIRFKQATAASYRRRRLGALRLVAPRRLMFWN